MFNISRTKSARVTNTNNVAAQEVSVGGSAGVSAKRAMECTDIGRKISRTRFHLKTKAMGSIGTECTLEVLHVVEW